MRHTLALLIIACCVCGVATAQDKAQNLKAKFSSYYDGKRYDFIITPEQLTNSPDWLEGQDNPPLAARRALEIAKAYLPKVVPNGEQWVNEGINLEPLGEQKWVYLIQFYDGKDGLHSSFNLVVLMNGETVEPKITKSKIP